METKRQATKCRRGTLPENLPDEEEPYRQYVVEKIGRGLKRAALEGSLNQSKVEQALCKWLTD